MKAIAPIVEDAPVPSANGVKRFDDDDSVAYRWALFDKSKVEAHMGRPVIAVTTDDMQELAYTLTGWHYSSSGAGQFFANVPWIRIVRNHILVTQRVGWDI